MQTTTTIEKRREVAREYGYPWPWQVRELVEEHAVEPNADVRELAEEWGISSKQLGVWICRHGFRTEAFRAKR